jgi:transposase
MCVKSLPIPPIPSETARVARAIFGDDALAMQLRDALGTLYADPDFADLFSPTGQPALAPWRLALVTLLQFAEGLTDRQAAHAVRRCIDWKYLLSLEITDRGFDYSVLSEFRGRLIAGGAERQLFTRLLQLCTSRGWLKARGRQRTDSTHVLAAVRELSRLEMVAETLRHALNVLAEIAPAWLHDIVPPEWFDRYSRRIEDARLPQAKEERRAYGEQIGRDGHCLLQALTAAGLPPAWLELPAIQLLQTMWQQQFVVVHDGQLRWRTADELTPSGDRIQSPYDPDARFATKHARSWTGYKVFLTETCDDDLPRLITDVQTTPAPVFDGNLTAPIEQALRERGLPPAEHLVDSAFVDAEQILASQEQHGITLVGPVTANPSWQTRAGQGYDASAFRIDWERKQAVCPQEQASTSWSEHPDALGHPMVSVKFARAACHPCPVRALCTKATRGGRHVAVRLHQQHELLQQVRQLQQTPEWQTRYHRRAGIEGLFSQATRCALLRRARYSGLAKVRLEHLLIATALNLVRLGAWWRGEPLSATRVSAFAQLRAA